MKKYVLLGLSLFVAYLGQAQLQWSGKIEYERKTNIHAFFEKEDGEEENGWAEKMKATLPKFMSTYFDMVFDEGHVLYKPGREVENPVKFWGSGTAADNTVLTDMKTGMTKSSKNIFEQKFLITDTAYKYKWKEREEIRTILGHQCHKAVTVICDSVYVVAFYTEDIPVSGGPEMFGGLPGLILELAVPRLHTTWVATKMEPVVPVAADFTIPEKGKKSTPKELNEKLKESMSDWGKSGARNMWWANL